MKQNKFEAILLVVVILLAVGIIFFGISSGKAYAEAKDRFDSAESSVSSMERGAPYPSMDNVEERREEVAEFRRKVAGLQEDLHKFRPETLEDISPAEFTTRLTQTSEKLRELYEKEGISFPDEWQAGFEAYTASPPKDDATKYLNYQLEAMEQVFTDLANASPSALVNVYRGKLPVEEGKSMDGAEEDSGRGRSRRRGRASRSAAGGPESDKPFYVMPVEITFRGRERAVRDFLSAIAGAEDYFASIRGVRVRNAKTDAPKTSDAEFEGGIETGEAEEGGDPFAGFDFGFTEEEGAEEEAAEEEEEVASSEQILGQVLGAEELFAHVQLELLLFKDDVELPEVSK